MPGLDDIYTLKRERESRPLEERANELAESWINGNLTFVIDEITEAGHHRAQVALLSVLVFSHFSAKDRMVFLRMLKDRL